MKAIVPDYRLDMLGEPCPYPAVATLEAMPQLKKGEILEVVSDCPQSINNIPLDARNHGYTVLDIQQDGEPSAISSRNNKRVAPGHPFLSINPIFSRISLLSLCLTLTTKGERYVRPKS